MLSVLLEFQCFLFIQLWASKNGLRDRRRRSRGGESRIPPANRCEPWAGLQFDSAVSSAVGTSSGLRGRSRGGWLASNVECCGRETETVTDLQRLQLARIVKTKPIKEYICLLENMGFSMAVLRGKLINAGFHSGFMWSDGH